METGVYIFENSEDFIQFMEELQQAYNENQEE